MAIAGIRGRIIQSLLSGDAASEQMMRTRYDAIIIGAGPAGSTTAILLARAGWSVALVERQRFPRRKVCGECIAAPNLALLDALGIGDAFNALAGPELRKLALMFGRETITADLPPMTHLRHQWGRALGREQLDPLLLKQAEKAGAHVLQPYAARRIGGQPGTFECDIKQVSSERLDTLTAPVLIAAHGSWDVCATENRERRQPNAADLFAFKANFHETNLVRGLLPVLAFDGGYGGLVVADEGITTLACCIRRDRLAALRTQNPGQRAGEAVEAYLRRSCAGVDDALSGARRDGSWLSVGPIRPGIRLERNGNGIFMIGNAAGEAHPIIGEGISMAMQSAWLLCAGLTEHLPQEMTRLPVQQRIQREYTEAWRRQFSRRIRLAALFAHLAMRPDMTSWLIPLLRRWPNALTWGARLSGKVKRPMSTASVNTIMP
jgi:flavin-dependent dehydrogenase